MTNCLKALFFSLIAHCAVAVGLAFWIGHASTVELPLLDLSAVEISFSEDERESPAVSPSVSDTPPPPEPDTPPPPEPDTPPPPEPDTPPPPEPDTPPPPVSDTPPPPEPDTPPPSEPDTPPPPEPDTPPPPEPDTPPPPVSDTPPPPEPDTPPPPEPDTPAPPVSDTPPPPEPDTPPPPEPPARPVGAGLQPAPVPASALQAPKQARVDAPPKLLKSIKPDYPKSARQRGEEGEVALELAINARGGVDSVTIVASSGYPELDAAAIRAATKARFVPAKAGKSAISSVARITISFRLTAR